MALKSSAAEILYPSPNDRHKAFWLTMFAGQTVRRGAFGEMVDMEPHTDLGIACQAIVDYCQEQAILLIRVGSYYRNRKFHVYIRYFSYLTVNYYFRIII